MIQILQGDWIEQLRTLPDESVQCCVCSPPYWGLRDYGTAEWDGGDSSCEHKGVDSRTVSGGAGKQYTNAGSNRVFSGDCKCGAKRIDRQLGLEKTPEEYVAKMVAGFREVRRVLKNDGTLWLNLGDSYAGSGQGFGDTKTSNKSNGSSRGVRIGSVHGESGHTSGKPPPPGLKAKDLVGIPWMVAFALRADGWYLRTDIIWSKPNPMPESVTDRPTKAHEYLFLLSKSQRYFYDAEAIQEPAMPEHSGHPEGSREYSGIRNKRTVWTVTTQGYPEAHFATYPPDLIKPCILAGSRPGDTILDPFGGSGTTGMVALELGRKAILIELNPGYIKLIEQRTNVTQGLAL